jgi:putative oxidoreductase
MKSDDLGKLVLRVALGLLILLHGIAKLSKGVGGIGGMLGAHGVPEAVAYLVYVGEVLAPALLILGLFTRPAACVIAINMLVAIWLVHTQQFWTLNNTGGWSLELQGMYLSAALAIALLGGGRLSLGGRYN